MASAAKHLSDLIVSPSDLKRAKRELEAVDDYLHQAGLRASALQGDDGKQLKLPQTSRLVDALATEMGANLLKAADRQKIVSYVAELAKKAPVLHISFASEPSAPFLAKLVIWLRNNIHPQVLVQVGLQPSIAAGCVLRTASRQYDMSLAQAFERERDQLVDSLRATTGVLPDEVSAIEQEAMKAAEAQVAKEIPA